MIYFLCKEFVFYFERNRELLKCFQRNKLIRIIILRDFINYKVKRMNWNWVRLVRN